jgi:hypothetical protein
MAFRGKAHLHVPGGRRTDSDRALADRLLHSRGTRATKAGWFGTIRSATTLPATPSSNVRKGRVHRQGHGPLYGVSDRSFRTCARAPNSNARTRWIHRSLKAAPVLRSEGTGPCGDPSSGRIAEPRAGEPRTAALVVRIECRSPVVDPCSARRRVLAVHLLRSAVGSGPSGRRTRMGATVPGMAETAGVPWQERAVRPLVFWASAVLAGDPSSCRPEVAWQ